MTTDGGRHLTPCRRCHGTGLVSLEVAAEDDTAMLQRLAEQSAAFHVAADDAYRRAVQEHRKRQEDGS